MINVVHLHKEIRMLNYACLWIGFGHRQGDQFDIPNVCSHDSTCRASHSNGVSLNFIVTLCKGPLIRYNLDVRKMIL